MYESPIEVVYGQMYTEFEDNVMKAVQSYNINVNKDALIYKGGVDDNNK